MHTLPSHLSDLIESFSEITDIKEKFQFLLELSEDLPEFPPEQKIEENKIQGCASNTWIEVSKNTDTNQIEIYGTGDALISKGMLAFFREAFAGLTAKEISEIKKQSSEIFLKSGVISSLSPSRANGAKAMLEGIYQKSEKFL